MQKERIYVCHTFYHVYVACLKELNLPEEQQGGATLVLSKMSNDFGNLDVRARESGIFGEVLWFDEKPFTYFKELEPLKEDTGSLVKNMRNRIRFSRRFGELEAPFVPVDFRTYKDIYVFCDSDPIGYYLNWKKIRYHAVEDGLDCLRYYDTARYDNRGHFGFKAWMAARGFIFIQNGYSRYCIDMEVNDISVLDHPIEKMVEVPREQLVQGLDADSREKLIRLFIANRKELEQALLQAKKDGRFSALILTEPLCKDLEMRKKLFRDLIAEYGEKDKTASGCRSAEDRASDSRSAGNGGSGRNDGEPQTGNENTGNVCLAGTGKAGTAENAAESVIVIKPHPRDILDYHELFPQYIVLDAKFPMEILNFVGANLDFAFDRVVTVYTVPSSIHCAKEKVYLGSAFMDRYEDPADHQNVTHGEEKVTHPESLKK